MQKQTNKMTDEIHKSTPPSTWKEILEDFYIEHDEQISNGEYSGKMLIVFKRWAEKKYQVPKPKRT